MAPRSMRTVRYSWPLTRSIRKSLAPAVAMSWAAISSPRRRNWLRSSPKILTATCDRTPETISSTRAAIGWLMAISTPGKNFNLSRISSAMRSWVMPSRHWSRGLRLTMGSDSCGWPGSDADSPRPSRETTVCTSGTFLMAAMAWVSIWIDSSIEILGTRTITGVIEPSCMVGMKAVPKKGTQAKLPNKARTATPRTLRGWPRDQCNMRK